MTEDAEEKKKAGRKALTITLCFLIIFCGLGLLQPRGLFVVPITEALGITRSAYAVTDTIRSATSAIVSLFFGLFIEKFGSKKLIVVGFASFTGSALLYAFAENVVLLYLGALLCGVGFALSGTAMVGRVISRVCGKHRGTVTGLVFAANGAGGALFAQVIGAFLKSEDPFGYRNAYYLMAGIFGFVLILILFLYKNPPAANEDASQPKRNAPTWKGVEFGRIRKTVYFYLTCVCVFVTGFTLQGLSAVRAAYLSDVGIDVAFIAIVSSVSSISLAFFKFFSGFLYEKTGLRVTVTLGMVCAVGSIVLLLLMSGDDTGKILAIACAVLTAVALPLETVMLTFYAGELFGEKSFSKALGVLSAMHYTGSALGSPAMNLCFDLTGSYKPAFTALGAVMIVMLLVIHVAISCARRLRARTETAALPAEGAPQDDALQTNGDVPPQGKKSV